MAYRAVLIGCGKIGSTFADDPQIQGIYTHAQAYVTCPDTSLVAIGDIDPVALQQCGDRWQVTSRYLNAQELLTEVSPEIVSICTPDRTHFDLAIAAIACPSVRAVFVEKPLATDLDRAAQIVELAHNRGVLVAVNYTRRYAQSHIQLRDYLKAGAIGQIQTIGGFYTKGVVHNGTHWFDLARFLIGEVQWVQGIDALQEGGDDPTLDAVLQFDTGVSAHLQACSHKTFSIFEMDIIGTTGRIRIVDSGHRFELYEAISSPYYSGYRALTPARGLQGGLENVLFNAVENLVHCLNHSEQPRCTGADAVQALAIALAVRESAQKQQPVAIGR